MIHQKTCTIPSQRSVTKKTTKQRFDSPPSFQSIVTVIRKRDGNAKVDSASLTDFRIKVYTALCQVPKGYVTTYKDLATKIGCRSNQAIGQALKGNPFAPDVPCHRVVQSNRTLGGFAGARTGSKIDKKLHLLRDEGVSFVTNGDNIRVAAECIYKF